MMNDPKNLSQASPGFIYKDQDQLINSLRTHRVNTLTEIRRIEKVFAWLDPAEVTEPLTTAWSYYVNSNNLLNELRGLTKNYPFSSELLDEAKWQVIEDPESGRSWNYCWLVLTKIRDEQLVTKHAYLLAAKPAMWGGYIPTTERVEQLAAVCIDEWTAAVNQMLRHWDTPPTTTGS
ncbi:MAG: hypothetical protein LQ347_004884 [Umbilicaria vellea]|nr:MAG: hypothetical protein LQ347_004884 [Umbilicaria vellea]